MGNTLDSWHGDACVWWCDLSKRLLLQLLIASMVQILLFTILKSAASYLYVCGKYNIVQ